MKYFAHQWVPIGKEEDQNKERAEDRSDIEDEQQNEQDQQNISIVDRYQIRDIGVHGRVLLRSVRPKVLRRHEQISTKCTRSGDSGHNVWMVLLLFSFSSLSSRHVLVDQTWTVINTINTRNRFLFPIASSLFPHERYLRHTDDGNAFPLSVGIDRHPSFRVILAKPRESYAYRFINAFYPSIDVCHLMKR